MNEVTSFRTSLGDSCTLQVVSWDSEAGVSMRHYCELQYRPGGLQLNIQ
jgi:hypothetical protein